MISDNLLKAVTKLNVYGSTIEDNQVCIKYVNRNKEDKEYFINIHELAHKCKEWAYDTQGLMVRTNAENTINGKAYRVSMAKICEFNDRGNWFFSTCADTEPETIFKACEWIMEDK